MVVTVEPPVFVGPEGLGARIIDNVLVTARRCRTAVANEPRSHRSAELKVGVS